MSDQIHAFMFEHVAVRGAVVQMDASWRFMRSLRAFPEVVESLLGASVVASALLASTIKSSSAGLLLQMQGDGPLSLLVAECSSDYGLRCTARWRDGITAGPLHVLVGNGHCAITLNARDHSRRYQGIVSLDGNTLAEALEGYMMRSEQLESRIVLFADSNFAGGLLLQRIPERTETDPDAWNRIVHMGQTVSAEELRELAVPMVLRRLFPRDDVRVYEGRALRFACSCTSARVRSMLKSLGQAEVDGIIREKGEIEVSCEFCGQRYVLTADDCRELFSGADSQG